jgi:hypothetical protein
MTPKAVGVVHVQQGVVLAGQGGEGGQVGRVAGHRVDPVHAQHPGRRGRPPQQPLGVADVARAEPVHGGPAGPGDHGRVVDGLVGAGVDQQRPLASQGLQDPLSMWVRVGRQRASSTPSSSTSSASTCSYRAGLAIPRAQLGMAAPAGQVLGDAGQDLGVEVEAEVVAGGEVGQPLAADPDHAPVDLVQHRVGHGVLGDEPGHLGGLPRHGVTGVRGPGTSRLDWLKRNRADEPVANRLQSAG